MKSEQKYCRKCGVEIGKYLQICADCTKKRNDFWNKEHCRINKEKIEARIKMVAEMDSIVYEGEEFKKWGEKYFVSKAGNILSHGSKINILKPQKNKNGYYKVMVCLNGERINKYIHHLVWETFSEQEIGEGGIRHMDDDKKNNAFDNLTLVPHRKSNLIIWHQRCKAGEVEFAPSNIVPVWVQDIRTKEVTPFYSLKECSKAMNVSEKTIRKYLSLNKPYRNHIYYRKNNNFSNEKI